MGAYLDNAATSFPKAPGVAQRVAHYIQNVGANASRSTYGPAMEAGMELLAARERVCRLFNFPRPDHVIFTAGNTAALNQVIKGLLGGGGHAVAGALEHNAVMRPLRQLEARGASFSRMECGPGGVNDVESAARLITPETRLVVMAHASNVCGAVSDAERLGQICRERGVPLVLDAAQTAGHYPIDFQKMGLSALCAPGHKGLLGPQGVGVLLLSPELAGCMEPLVAGGTGSVSDSEFQPRYMPDKFESGTLNLPGIYGLSAALEYILAEGVEALRQREERLTRALVEGLSALPVRVLSSPGMVGVVSVDFVGQDNAVVADRLEQEFGVLCRCGMHCAPAAHRALGTFPQGTVRFSLGHASTMQDVELAVRAAAQVAGG